MNQVHQGHLDQAFWSESELKNDQLMTERTTKLVSDHMIVQVTLTPLDDYHEEVTIPVNRSAFFDSIVHQLFIEYPVPIKEVWISSELRNASQSLTGPQKKRFTMLILFESSLDSVEQHFQLKLKSFKHEKIVYPLHYTIQIVNHQYDQDKLENFKKDYDPIEPHAFHLPKVFRIRHELDTALKKEDLLQTLSLEKNFEGKTGFWRHFGVLFQRYTMLIQKGEFLLNALETASNNSLKFQQEYEDAFQEMGTRLDNLKEQEIKPILERCKKFDKSFEELVVAYEEKYGIGNDLC